MRRLIAVALIAAIVASTVTALIAIRVTATPAPQALIAHCSVWATTQYPTLPDHTRTDVCSDDNGSLHYVQ